MPCHRLRSLVYTVAFPAGFDRKKNYLLLKLIKKLKGQTVFVKIVLHEKWTPFRRLRVQDPRDKTLQRRLGHTLEQAMDSYSDPHVRIVASDPDSGFHALRQLFKLGHGRGVRMCASVSILQLHQQWLLPRCMGSQFCHLHGQQLQQRLKLVGLVTA